MLKEAYTLEHIFLKGLLLATVGLWLSNCPMPTPPTSTNHIPVITSSPVTQVDEGNSYNYDVNAIDSDGDNLTYSLTQAPAWLSMNSNTGMISGTAPEVSSDEYHNISVKVSDGISFDTQNYTLTVKDVPPPPPPDYLDISGRMEDCETNTGRHGIIRVYDDRINTESRAYFGPVWEYSNLLGEFETDSNGNFSFTLNKLVDANDKIYLRAVIGANWSGKESYIRTVELDATDNNPITDTRANPAIKPVMFDNPNSSYDDGLLDTEQKKIDFREHMGRINVWSADERYYKDFLNGQLLADGMNGNPYHGLKKMSFNRGLPEDFKGIEVSSDDYTNEEYNTIKNIILNCGYIRAQEISDKTIWGNNHQDGDSGWGSVVKSALGDGPYAILYDGYQNGYLDIFGIHLNTLAPEIVIHEIVYHGLLSCVGHSNGRHGNGSEIPELFSSVGVYTGPHPSPPDKITTVDIKANYLIDEDTYMGMDTLDDILGMN